MLCLLCWWRWSYKMPVISKVNKIEENRYMREEGPKEDYARLEIDLNSIVGTNVEIAVQGSYLAKISYDGSGNYFKIDTRHAAKIYADEFGMVRREFSRLWFTNPSAQAGKKLVLQVGHVQSAEITPDTKEKNMKTSFLNQNGDGVGSNFGTPGAGNAFEICGYQIIETEKADMAVAADGEAHLEFEESSIKLWTGIKIPQVAVTNYHTEMHNLVVRGGSNEACTLRNANVSAGSSEVRGVIFYRVVTV